MTESLWNHLEPIADKPPWITGEITGSTLEAIYQGGCASGAYMPAVTYRDALATMAAHGDEVTEYIAEHGYKPSVEPGTAWSVMACNLLSLAVEIWVMNKRDELLAQQAEEV